MVMKHLTLLVLSRVSPPQQNLTLVIHRKNEDDEHVILTARLDTPVEVDYYRNDGILPYVLRGLLES